VKLVLIEESTDVALDLHQGWSDDSKRIIAPALITGKSPTRYVRQPSEAVFRKKLSIRFAAS
jgi:hypothetical protein